MARRGKSIINPQAGAVPVAEHPMVGVSAQASPMPSSSSSSWFGLKMVGQ
ncbi:MAG: hypothetical protein ACJATT_001110, partial [Myxococcota bacterium]